MSTLLRIILLALGSGAAACASVWGSGLTDEPSGLPKTANALVVVLGDDGFTVAGARLTGAVNKEFASGLFIDNARPGSQLPRSAHQAEWVASWSGSAVPGAITVGASVAGPTLVVELESLSLEATLEVPGAVTCSGTVAGSNLRLMTRLALESTKSGALEASLLDDVEWVADTPSGEFSDCHDAFWGREAELDDLVAGLISATAQDVVSVMAPLLEVGLPDALGVGLGTRVDAVFADASLGTGDAQLELVAPDGPGDKPWSYVDGRFYVFFTAGLDGSRHDCVPPDDMSPPVASGVQVPASDPSVSTTLLLSEAALVRSLHLVWLAGRICGDRSAGDIEWPMQEVMASWPQLAELGDTELSARLWPQGGFEVSVGDGDDGTPELQLSTSSVSVEIYVTVDDARILATAFTVGVSISGPLSVDADGEVWLATEGISLTGATPTKAGILAPPDDIEAALALPLAEAILNNTPVWQLPYLPVGETAVEISRTDGYLVFSWPTPSTIRGAASNP